MKNTFVKLILITGAAMGTVLYGQSADQSAPAPQAAAPVRHQVTPEQTLKHLAKKLALTSDQQNQLLPVLTDRQQQISAIQSDGTLTKKEQHAKLVAVRSDSESRIRMVLTDTQRTAYDEMKQEQRERAKTQRMTAVQNP
jgi:protein CpxP